MKQSNSDDFTKIIDAENEQFRTEIGTMNRKGERKWVYAKKPSGRLTNYRSLVAYALLLALVLLPFIKLPNGNPVFMLNVFSSRFILFGQPFFTTDFFLLAIGMLVGVVFVILFTTVYGRIFCGWICPQTIFMESVFRRIEYMIEGDRHKQIRLDKQDWDAEKIGKKGLKWFIYAIISFFFANILLSYLIGMDELIFNIKEGPGESPTMFLVLLIFTGLFFFVFTWFREQVCTLVCPYGRLQGVLIDKSTIQVSYDFKRGESINGRSKFRKNEDRAAAGKGDCIDCGQCVAVCPTGIDIRHGSQLECVNCAVCVDACDEIMEKIDLPKGLIKYASEDNIINGTSFKFTGRLAAFTAILAGLLVVMSVFLTNRSDIELKFLQTPGRDYVEKNGLIENQMQYNLMNKTNKDLQVHIRVKSHKDSQVDILSDGGKIFVKKGELKQGYVNVKIPKNNLSSYKEKVMLELVDENNKVIDTFEISFMAPFSY